MYAYPTNAPCLTREGLHYVERYLPSDGEIMVEPGQRVAADEVIAAASGVPRVDSIDAVSELGVSPAEIIKGLTQELRTPLKAGDVIVALRAGLRKKELKAREDGVVIAVDPVSGQVLYEPARSRLELKAYVSGVVETIDGRRGVTLSTVAMRVQGIWGIGPETVGVIRVLTAQREDDLKPEALDARASLGIVVAGRAAGVEALKKAVSVGVKAVILGSIEEHALRAFLEAAGRGTPRWYAGGPTWQLPTPEPSLPFTLIVTEGFGRLPMAAEVFDALQEAEGQEASLVGTTRLRGKLTRPEIMVPLAGRGEGRPAPAAPAELAAGTRVRLVDPQHLGLFGTVINPPALRPAGDGLLQDMVDVELERGGWRRLPVSNIEVLS